MASVKSCFGRSSAAVVAAFLAGAVAGHAQTQQQSDWCAGKNGATDEQKIGGCTALIQSKRYAGKDLAFAFNNRGLAYYDKQDYARAIADFNEALRLDPRFAHGYNNRALAFLASGMPDRAVADFGEAIRLEPTLAAAFNGRGNAHFALKDAARAIADYSAAIKLAPNPDFSHYIPVIRRFSSGFPAPQKGVHCRGVGRRGNGS